MTLIQTLAILLSGYVASQALVHLGLYRELLEILVRRSRGRPALLLLAILGGSSALSLVLPNALTVLTLLPLVALLLHNEGDQRTDAGLATILGLAVLYGANIGGTGSLLGSPANLYLLVSLGVLDVPGRQAVQFVPWLIFGIPLAALLVLAAWGILWTWTPASTRQALANMSVDSLAAGHRLHSREGPPSPTDTSSEATRHRRHLGLLLVGALAATHFVAIGLLAAWFPQPLARLVLPKSLGASIVVVQAADLAAVILAAATAIVFLCIPFRTDPNQPPTTPTHRQTLIHATDLWRGLPMRGVLLAGFAIAILFAVAKLGGSRLLEATVADLLPANTSPNLVLFGLTTLALFATEILNNTTVATVLFPFVPALASTTHLDPVPTAIAVSMASTCAFMSPLATPVNALAFGSIPHIRIRTMVTAGLAMNLVAALLITLWAATVVPAALTS